MGGRAKRRSDPSAGTGAEWSEWRVVACAEARIDAQLYPAEDARAGADVDSRGPGSVDGREAQRRARGRSGEDIRIGTRGVPRPAFGTVDGVGWEPGSVCVCV